MKPQITPAAGVGLVLLFAATQGCATPDRRNTWAQDRAEGISEVHIDRAGVRPRVPLARVPVDVRGDHPSAEQVAHELELALLRFTARRRALSRELGSQDSGPWPTPLTRAWEDILYEVEVGLRTANEPLPQRLLVQARVTLEAELELTARAHGPAEPGLKARIRAAYVQVATQMRQSRPRPTQERPRDDLDLTWPVSPLIVTSPFGYRRDPILGPDRVRFHAGVDLGGRRGDVVVAAGAGRIVGAGWQGGHGRTVTVQHPGGYVTTYAHLARILVHLGDAIDAGSPVGLMGSTGRSTGPHLHFEVRKGNVPIDPLEAIRLRGGSLARR